jgi:dipeptidyl aminopeptidase/acylaminoacyl peptidase
VTDLASGESRQVLDGLTGPVAWKPGTHLLTYGLGTDEEYFGRHVETPDPNFARGIWGADLDQDPLEPVELVKPERGYHLGMPVWSPDGRFLAFDEVHMYEGRGMFAYYDFESGEYVAWEEAIGNYAWSPDGSLIAYDRMTYTATGAERIFLRERQGGEERQLSPDFPQGYASFPVFSPAGDRIAYMAGLEGPDSMKFGLYVQDLPDGEARELGVYESLQRLAWTPDGQNLTFIAGPYGAQRFFMVSAADGAVILELGG